MLPLAIAGLDHSPAQRYLFTCPVSLYLSSYQILPFLQPPSLHGEKRDSCSRLLTGVPQMDNWQSDEDQ